MESTVRAEHGPDIASTPEKPSFFAVEGMTCSNCVRHVTQAIQALPGVAAVRVDLERGQARVRWSAESAPDSASVVRAVQAAGFDARVESDTASSHAGPASSMNGWRLNVVLGFLVLIPLAIGEWSTNWHAQPWFRWTSLGLASLVQIFAGARFYRGAIMQLRHGNSNMDTLVALGSSTAFGYSAWSLIAGQSTHLFFLESVAIITLISAGHWLESQATQKAAHAIRGLFKLAPPTCRRLKLDRAETETPVEHLKLGDEVVLRPGDRVPVDGEVIEGASAVDESMITGESVPVDKTRGARLYAGTLNVNGRMVFRVTATGEATALAQIVAAVEKCQTSRAEIQRLGDRVSSIFVPVVLVIALATAGWWGFFPEQAQALLMKLSAWLWPLHWPESGRAALFAAGVLIVACPCAMGLATPAALMIAAQVAARRGILIRDGVALEKSGNITMVVFDKTGTLTTGTMQVVGILSAPNAPLSPEQMKALAAALGHPSKHPISQALTRQSGRFPALAHWEEVRGSGVTGRLADDLGGLVHSTPLFQGSEAWLTENEVDLGPLRSQVQEWRSQGATVVGLAAGRTLLAWFALQDQLKPRAAEVIATLRQQGKQVAIISGDARATVQSIARQLHVDPTHAFAEVRPEKKSALVQQLQDQGEHVAFVGDGINDAPALEQADLGVAVSQASDLARESADLILLNSDIQAFPEALSLAQATLRTIKQNLFWAFFYNAAAIPLAAVGFLSPILCALAMALSDLIVIGNSLRLHWWRPS
jgi:P-type Cu+ transporter